MLTSQQIGGIIVRRLHMDSVDCRSFSEDFLSFVQGCIQHIDESVLRRITRPELYDTDDSVEVCFFQAADNVSDDELEKEYVRHGLVPVNPYLLARVNENDPGFPIGYPNLTVWKDDEGWHFVSFEQEIEGLIVSVQSSPGGHLGYYWFAGLRKQ